MNIYTSKTEYLEAEIKRLHEELQEQCRINGMGAEREARLMAVNQELVKVLKLALEALENWWEFDPENWGDADNKAITAIREALEQPNITKYLEKDNSEQPASKPFVGLTDEEIERLSVESGKATFLNDDEQTGILWFDGDCMSLARAIEAKLREKNAP